MMIEMIMDAPLLLNTHQYWNVYQALYAILLTVS